MWFQRLQPYFQCSRILEIQFADEREVLTTLKRLQLAAQPQALAPIVYKYENNSYVCCWCKRVSLYYITVEGAATALLFAAVSEWNYGPFLSTTLVLRVPKSSMIYAGMLIIRFLELNVIFKITNNGFGNLYLTKHTNFHFFPIPFWLLPFIYRNLSKHKYFEVSSELDRLNHVSLISLKKN